MAAQVISLLRHLIQERDHDAYYAVFRAFKRPYPFPTDADHPPTDEQIVTWFIESLWLEGFRVVKGSEEDDYE